MTKQEASSPLDSRDDIVIFVALMIGCLMAQALGRLINRPNCGPIFALALGAGVGAVIHFGLQSGASDSAVFKFNEDIFTYALVPPIVFNDAFNLPKRRFFKGFGISCVFGVLGTLLQTCSVGLILYAFADAGVIHALDGTTVTEALIFAVAISPSAGSSLIEAAEFPALHGIAVGESVINDPMCIILFTALRKWARPGVHIDADHQSKIAIEFFTLIAGSTAIGVLGGLMGSFLLARVAGRVQGLESVQFGLLFLVPYLSYVLAERIDWSGITSLFSCGVLLANYGYRTCASTVQVSSVNFFEMLSFLCETFMYTYIGLNIWIVQADLGRAETAPHQFIMLTIAAVSVSRMAHTGILSGICRIFCANSPSWKETVAVGYAGVLRDTVTLALTSSIRHRTHGSSLVAVAFYLLLFTTLFIPATFPFLCKLLKLEEPEEHSRKMHIELKRHSGELVHAAPPYAMLSQQVPPEVEQYSLHNYWRRLDNKLLRPVFGGARSDVMHNMQDSAGHAHEDQQPVTWQDEIPDPVANSVKPDDDQLSSSLGTPRTNRASNPLKYGY